MSFHDLSHPIIDGMPVYPGTPPVEVSRRESFEADGVRVTDLVVDTHVGTHIDAPSHMTADGNPLDAFDVSAFAFDARRVDCTDKGPREPIRPADLPDIPDDRDPPESTADPDLLVLHTGWDDHWGTEQYRDHPYLSAEAAGWCADRGYGVGLDAFSPDPTPSARGRESDAEPEGHPAHAALLGAGEFVVENLTGLGDLPETFTLQAFPLAIRDADGSPVRAVARTDA